MQLLRGSRETVKQALCSGRLYEISRLFLSSRALVLRYHSLRKDDKDVPQYVSPSISISVRLFEQQMSYLAKKYACLSIEEVSGRLHEGKPLPPRTIVVTFDDGYYDNYALALPVLRRYDVPAVVYLVSDVLVRGQPLWTSLLRYAFMKSSRPLFDTSVLGNGETQSYPLATLMDREWAIRGFTNILNRMPSADRTQHLNQLFTHLRVDPPPDSNAWFLSKNHVDEMMKEKVTFGAHTASHPNLPGIGLDEAEEEIVNSKVEIELLLGKNIDHFSFPNSGSLYPHFNSELMDQVKKAGFLSAVTSTTGWVGRTSDPFQIRRIGINSYRSPLPNFLASLEKTRLVSGKPPGR